MVKLGSISTVIAFKIGLPIKSIVKATIFRQFCGGETIDESEDRISQLARLMLELYLTTLWKVKKMTVILKKRRMK